MRAARLLCASLIAARLAAQASDGTTVSGVVRDSIARAPLAGALVQLVAADSPARADRSVVADRLGRFTIANVPSGRYTIGFIHPMLDSLGLEPPLRDVTVRGERALRVDIGTPSPAELRGAICRTSASDSSSLVVGFVRDARDRTPLSSVAVTGAWLEIAFTGDSVSRTTPQVQAMTADNGWFALCGMPASGSIWLSAGRGADSTGLIEIHVSREGFARRDLYLGPAQTLTSVGGTVVDAAGKRPIAGALVTLGDGSLARTDERGTWTLWDVPTGTRMLDVRAVGYYPDRRPIDVTSEAPPVRIELPTLRSVLDTVEVTASRLERNIKGFETRRRGSGVGRFLTADYVARLNPLQTSDVFRMIPGMAVRWDYVTMSGQKAGTCSPALFIDGAPVNSGLRGLAAGDIDIWARPDEIAGIEIYHANQGPVQFQRALSACGSIIIWMKAPKVNPNASSMNFRVVQAAVIVALMLLIAAAIDGR